MTDYTLNINYTDGTAAGAKATADGLTAVGDAAVASEEKVGKFGRSMKSINNSFDPVSKAAKALAIATNQLAQATAAAAADLKKGTGDADANARSVENLTKRVAELTQKHADAIVVAEAMKAASKGVSEAMSEEAAALAKTGMSVEQLRLKWDPLYKTSRAYATSLDEIEALEKNGFAGQAAIAREKLTAAYAESNEAAKEAIALAKAEAQALKDLQAAALDLERAYRASTNNQKVSDRFQAPKVSGMADAFAGVSDSPGKSAEESANAIYAALDKERAAIDETFRVWVQYEKKLADIAAAEKSTAIDTTRAAELRQQAAESYASMNAATKEAIALAKAEAQALQDVQTALDARRAYAASTNNNAVVAKLQAPQMSAMADRFAGVSDSPSKSAEESARAMVEALDAERGAVDDAYQAFLRYEQKLRDIAAAEASTAVSAVRAAELRADASEAYRKTLTPPDPPKKPPVPVDPNYGVAVDQTRYAIDKLYRSSKDYEIEDAKIVAGWKAGSINLGTMHRLLDDNADAFQKSHAPIGILTDKIKENSDATVRGKATAGEMTFAVRQLGVQSIQMASGIATGQPVLMTMIQQIHQMVDVSIATRTGFDAVAIAAKGAFNMLASGPGAIGAVVLGFGLIAVNAEATNRQFNTMSAQLRATRNDYDELSRSAVIAAKSIGGEGVMSTGEALTAATKIAGTKEFSGTKEELQDLIRLSKDVSVAFDEDISAGAGRVAAALKSPKDAAQAFADQGLRGMTQAMADSITKMQESGKFEEAQAATLQVLKSATQDAALAMTPLQKALKELSAAFNSTGKDGKSFAMVVGENIMTGVAALVSATAAVIKAIKDARDFLNSLKDSGSTTGSVIGNVLSNLLRNNPITGLTARVLGIGDGGGSPASWSGVAPKLTAASNSTGVDLDLLTRLQKSEGLMKNGRWQDSPTGAIGPMQVTQSTWNGMKNQPGAFPGMSELTDIRDESQNVAAGAILFAHLLAKYGNVRLAVLAYHDGETVVDGVLNGKSKKNGDAYAYSSDAVAQADKVTAGYTGSGLTSRAPLVNRNDLSAQGVVPLYGDDQAMMDRARKTANTKGTSDRTMDDSGAAKLARELEEMLTARAKIEALLAKGGLSDDATKRMTEDWNNLTGAIQTAKGEHYQAGDAIQTLVRGLQEGLPPLEADAGAARTLAEAMQTLKVASDSAGRPATETERLAVEAAAMKKLSTEYRDQVAVIDRSIEGQTSIAAAYDKSYEAGARATVEVGVQEEALKIAVKGHLPYIEVVKTLTQAKLDLMKVTANAAQAIKNQNTNDELEYLSKEITLIGKSAEQRERELAVLRERQRIMATPGADINSKESQDALALAAAKVDKTMDFQRQENAFNELANVGSQAFDRIGGAITDAFANGSMKALDFGNIAKAVMSQIIQYFLKISLLNPILNTLFGGTHRVTLGDTSDALSQAGIGGGSASSGGSSVSSIGSMFGLGKSLFGDSFTDIKSGFSNLMGNWLIDPSGVSMATTNTALANMGGAYGPASLSQLQAAGSVSSGATVGSMLGGVGAGFGAGMFLNSMLGGNKLGGTVGSGVGALGGALIGSIIPGIGTLIGGLIGGAAGGGLGGLVGPKPSVQGFGFRLQSAGFDTAGVTNRQNNNVFGSDGPAPNPTNDMADSLLPISRKFYNASSGAAFDQADQLVARVNAFLADNKLQVGGVSVIGGNKNGADYSSADAGSLSEGFTRLRFRSKDDEELNRTLSSQVFDDPAKLEAWVSGFKEIKAFINSIDDPVSQFEASLQAVNDQFDKATVEAKKYNLAEDQLVAGRAKAIAQINEQALKEQKAIKDGLTVRDLNVQGRNQEAALVQFDAGVPDQYDTLKTQFKNWFGKDFATNDKYLEALALLTKVLGEERDAIVNDTAAKDSARTNVATTIDSLRQFALSLQQGNMSALSPQQKYALATSQFNTVGQKAVGGDFKSLQDVQGYASAFLASSRDLNGSGEQYAKDYNQVIGLLQSVANAPTDALTASAMTAIQQSATDKLKDALTGLGTAVAGTTTDAVTNYKSAFGDFASAQQIANDNAAKAITDNGSIYAKMYADGVAELVNVVASHTPPAPIINSVSNDQMWAIMEYETTRVVNAVADVKTAINTLRWEVQHQASAPAGYGSDGNNDPGPGDSGINGGMNQGGGGQGMLG